MIGKKQMKRNNLGELEKGFEMLCQGRYGDAKLFFEKYPDKEDPLVLYGLATARFKANIDTLRKEEVLGIINDYETVIQKDNGFADAYIMCAMGYELLASIKTKEYKKYPNIRKKGIKEIKDGLEHALSLLNTATELEPSFNHISEHEKQLYQKRITGLDSLEKYYNDQQPVD